MEEKIGRAVNVRFQVKKKYSQHTMVERAGDVEKRTYQNRAKSKSERGARRGSTKKMWDSTATIIWLKLVYNA